MPRLHLFELEDQQWFPKVIRNYMTDYLQHVSNSFDIYKTIGPVLKKGLDKTESKQIIDLCSGGGGGWMKLADHVKEELPGVKIVLSDYYPNIPAFENMKKAHFEIISFDTKSVNAMDVPQDQKGLRTQFLSFHHFKPDGAKKILQNAVDAKQPIAIFEAQQRSVGHFVQFFLSPIFVLLMTPAIKPFSLGRLFFTYLVPIVPLCIWLDGLVSVLRTYSPKELEKLISELNNKDSFDWEISFVKSGPSKVFYLLATPK
jgi:hypothetical protein